MVKLLTRQEFKAAVIARDKRCVLCGADGVDAHHIMERRLWPDGGYYVDNGALVCGPCHLRCESTDVSTSEVRKAAGIKVILLPPHLAADTEYDKWGNPVLPNGRRLVGELFRDESVQRTIAGHLHLFLKWVKYPRTYHVAWSLGRSDDDKVQNDLSGFDGQRVIVTEKMDGENTSMYSDHVHARSLETAPHPSRTWIRQYHAGIAMDIPEGWRICGENLYAKHSIGYTDLPSYFLVFSIWNGLTCLSWDDTVEWCSLMNLHHVPVLYDGIYDEAKIKSLTVPNGEGYVIRLASDFQYGKFKDSLVKFVRANHVQTGTHWMQTAVVKNGLSLSNENTG